jgi:hypothetical protein
MRGLWPNGGSCAERKKERRKEEEFSIETISNLKYEICFKYL